MPETGQGGPGPAGSSEPSQGSLDIQVIEAPRSDCVKFAIIDFWTLSPGVTALVWGQKGRVGRD